MIYSPEQHIAVNPEEILAWCQVAYYLCGAFGTFAAGYLAIKQARRLLKRKRGGEDDN